MVPVSAADKSGGRSSPRMRVRFLGTGGSFGIPMVGCSCAVCTSTDPRNQRLRTSALVEIDDHNVLIDTSPDLRTQALMYGVRRVDAVLYTHDHADHTAGVDDLRVFSMRGGVSLQCYGYADALDAIRRRFSYIFSAEPPPGSRPRLELCPVRKPFQLWGEQVMPLDVYHGQQTIAGYRIGDLGYVTDASGLPYRSVEMLRGVRVLALNALRYQPHPMHLSLGQAVELASEIGAESTYFIHMGHELDHAATEARLPDGMHLAYDGLVLDL